MTPWIIPPTVPPSQTVRVLVERFPVIVMAPPSPTILALASIEIVLLKLHAPPLFLKAPPFEMPVPLILRPSDVTSVNPFKSSDAPDPTIVIPAVVPNGELDPVPAEPSCMVPSLTDVWPVNEFEPESTIVPIPALVIPADPLITPLIVRSTASVPSLATENALVTVPKATGQEMEAQLFPVPALFTVTLPPKVSGFVDPVTDEPDTAPQYSVTLLGLPSVYVDLFRVTPSITVNAPFTVRSPANTFSPPPARVKLLYEAPL